MGKVSLTGQDVFMIDGRVFNDLADGDVVVIDFPEDLAVVKASKNGNTLIIKKESGRLVDVTVRVLLGSTDDTYLNGRMAEWKGDSAGFTLLTGTFIKRVGDGAGGRKSKVYQMSAGVFKRDVPAKSNTEGDTEQAVAVYQMQFGFAEIPIQ